MTSQIKLVGQIPLQIDYIFSILLSNSSIDMWLKSMPYNVIGGGKSPEDERPSGSLHNCDDDDDDADENSNASGVDDDDEGANNKDLCWPDDSE